MYVIKIHSRAKTNKQSTVGSITYIWLLSVLVFQPSSFHGFILHMHAHIMCVLYIKSLFLLSKFKIPLIVYGLALYTNCLKTRVGLHLQHVLHGRVFVTVNLHFVTVHWCNTMCFRPSNGNTSRNLKTFRMIKTRLLILSHCITIDDQIAFI